MAYIGSIKCPDCGSPISSNTSVCPYCHSTAPASAAWRGKFTWKTLVIILVIGGGVWALDHFWGIKAWELLDE